jgi:hypothetical protein
MEIITICKLGDAGLILILNLVNLDVFVTKEIRNAALISSRKISYAYFKIYYSLHTDIRRNTNYKTARSVN